MIEFMQAHPISIVTIVFSLFVVPFYWFFVLPQKKAIVLAFITAIVGSLLFLIPLFSFSEKLGPFGALLIPTMWFTPAIIVYCNKSWFGEMKQKPLVGLQIFRLIGATFLIEMSRGHIPSSFALPAGIGDVVVGLFALYLFLSYKEIPRWGIITLICIGLFDFLMAFSFGFTSLPGPLHLFATDFNNQVNLFPTGLIPLFLVPYAIVFHILSIIALKSPQKK